MNILEAKLNPKPCKYRRLEGFPDREKFILELTNGGWLVMKRWESRTGLTWGWSATLTDEQERLITGRNTGPKFSTVLGIDSEGRISIQSVNNNGGKPKGFRHIKNPLTVIDRIIYA